MIHLRIFQETKLFLYNFLPFAARTRDKFLQRPRLLNICVLGLALSKSCFFCLGIERVMMRKEAQSADLPLGYNLSHVASMQIEQALPWMERFLTSTKTCDKGLTDFLATTAIYSPALSHCFQGSIIDNIEMQMFPCSAQSKPL